MAMPDERGVFLVSEIPADILSAAEVAFLESINARTEGGAVLAIARAILAERKRRTKSEVIDTIRLSSLKASAGE